MSQLILNRSKRGINELGTIWKWKTGTPDHDNFITVQNKIDDLVQNNNDQFVINSKIFKQPLKIKKFNLENIVNVSLLTIL